MDVAGRPGAAAFIPGAIAGGLVGLFIIRPVNAVLGWLFRGFNRLFDRMTAVYGRMVGGVLRLSVSCCMLYGGLLVLTYWEFIRTPTGFVPQQDKGYLLLNVQLPDSASVERTRCVSWPGSRPWPARRRASAHTVGVSGQSLLLNANAPNLGSLYVMLERVRASGAARSLDRPTRIAAANPQERCQGEVRGAIVSAFGAPPIDGLGTTGGFKLIIEDRGNLGPRVPCSGSATQIVERGNRTPGLQGLFNSSRANTPWLYLRHRPDQVHGPGRAGQRAVQHAAGLPGLVLRQQLQRVRPDLAGERPGRPAVPRRRHRTSASSRCGTTRGR